MSYPASMFRAFDGFAKGVDDPLANVFRKVGSIATLLIPLGILLSNRYPHEKAYVYLAFIGFLMGPIMFICFGARIVGMQRGIVGFGRQFWAVFRKTILYLFIPAAILTLVLYIYAAYVIKTI